MSCVTDWVKVTHYAVFLWSFAEAKTGHPRIPCEGKKGVEALRLSLLAKVLVVLTPELALPQRIELVLHVAQDICDILLDVLQMSVNPVELVLQSLFCMVLVVHYHCGVAAVFINFSVVIDSKAEHASSSSGGCPLPPTPHGSIATRSRARRSQ